MKKRASEPGSLAPGQRTLNAPRCLSAKVQASGRPPAAPPTSGAAVLWGGRSPQSAISGAPSCGAANHWGSRLMEGPALLSQQSPGPPPAAPPTSVAAVWAARSPPARRSPLSELSIPQSGLSPVGSVGSLCAPLHWRPSAPPSAPPCAPLCPPPLRGALPTCGCPGGSRSKPHRAPGRRAPASRGGSAGGRPGSWAASRRRTFGGGFRAGRRAAARGGSRWSSPTTTTAGCSPP